MSKGGRSRFDTNSAKLSSKKCTFESFAVRARLRAPAMWAGLKSLA